MLSEADKRAVVFIAAVDGIGSATLRRLISWTRENQITLSSIVTKPAQFPFFKQNSKIYDKICQFTQVNTIDSYWQRLIDQQIQVILSEEVNYPFLLKQAKCHPLLLYCRGNLTLLQANRPVAVIGTRRATAYGQRATRVIVGELVQLGATIVSGFMYGIDTIAHQSAINSGGATIAVLGFGFGQMFPSAHTTLFEELLEKNSVFVSQFTPNTPATPGNFPARNQIVAGMSLATLVVEAAAVSGSLITADAALDEGRAVCAVPGPFDNPFSQGTKALINQGATLVTSGQDVLAEAGLIVASGQPSAHQLQDEAQLQSLNQLQQQLVALVDSGIRLPDDLSSQLGLTATQLSFELTQLEMMGLLQREQVGWIRL